MVGVGKVVEPMVDRVEFWRESRQPHHVVAWVSGTPRDSYAMCGADVTGMRKLAPFDVGDGKSVDMAADMCVGCAAEMALELDRQEYEE